MKRYIISWYNNEPNKTGHEIVETDDFNSIIDKFVQAIKIPGAKCVSVYLDAFPKRKEVLEYYDRG